MSTGGHLHPNVAKRQTKELARQVAAAEETLTAARAAHGESHPQVADALSALGLLHQQQSVFDKAETALLEALAIREKHPADTPAQVEQIRMLARFYDISGHRDKVRPLLQRAAQMESHAFQTGMCPVAPAEPPADDFEEFVENMVVTLPNTFWTWFSGGILLPLVLAYIGFFPAVRGRITLYGRSPGTAILVEGIAAHMLGMAWIMAAAYAHFQFFWPHRNRKVCALGRVISFFAGFLFLITGLIRMWTG